MYDDRITAVKCPFNQKARLHDLNIDCYVAMGPKQLLLARDDGFQEIFEVMQISQKHPQTSQRNGVTVFEMYGGDTKMLKFENHMGSTASMKIISEFQKTSFKFQMEMNTFPTIAIPEGLDEYITNYLELKEEIENPQIEEEESYEMRRFSDVDDESGEEEDDSFD